MSAKASFRAYVASTILAIGTAVHVTGIVCSYWFSVVFQDVSVHEGLWQICVSNKTSGLGECRQIPSSYPVWFHGVQTLECLGGACELVTIAIAVRYLCRGATYNNWLCQFFGVFAGLLNAVGGIIYTQRSSYPTWNLVDDSSIIGPITDQVTSHQSQLCWAFGLVMGSAGIHCIAVIFFVWESIVSVSLPTTLPYQLLDNS